MWSRQKPKSGLNFGRLLSGPTRPEYCFQYSIPLSRLHALLLKLLSKDKCATQQTMANDETNADNELNYLHLISSIATAQYMPTVACSHTHTLVKSNFGNPS